MFEIVSSAKVLGFVISSDLKWSAHIDSITTKASKRLNLLSQLKRAGIAQSFLVRFYCSVIRSILEYAYQVFHCNLPLYLSEEIERIQRHALRIIFPDCSYSAGLVKAILGDPGAVSGDGKMSKTGEKQFGRFSSPEFFFARFRHFPVPTNCPWVSEDELKLASQLCMIEGVRCVRNSSVTFIYVREP